MTFPCVYLVRHGETAWSLSRQHTGRIDISLTEQGEAQARALRAHLQDIPFAIVLSSPLLRARRTAELAGYAEALKTEVDLLEWDYGTYEGRRTSEIRQERPGWDGFVQGYPGGEPLSAVAARADRVLARVRALSGNVLLFAHRDILRVIAVRWIDLPAQEARRLYLETGSLSVLGYDHDLREPVIRGLNQSDQNRR